MIRRRLESLALCSTVAVLTIAPSLRAQVTGDTPITILQTTDLHHHANGSDHTGLDVDPRTGMGATGAYARIAAYIAYVRANAGHPVVLVDSGDWTMGTLYDLTLSSRPVALAFLDAMQYDCVTLGNHEFDYTPKGLAAMLAAAQSAFGFKTPIVASNMNASASTDLTPFLGAGKAIQTTRVQTLSNGLKVGYIGLMGKAAVLNAPAAAPVTFTDYSTQYSTIQSLVNGLRSSGVQVVIALAHAGTNSSGTAGEDVDLAHHVTGIDVIASGHTHSPLSSAHAVTNGSWTTQIIDAGAYGANVARIDLTYHPSTNSITANASSNVAMTDASLTAVQSGLAADPATIALVGATDLQLNAALGPFFSQTFPDYDPKNLAKGIYHPVGSAAQNMAYNSLDPEPSPNGLGDLAADAVRSIPNSIVAQTLAAAGGNPANLPGYDFNPFQAGVVATGVLRGKLPGNVPLSFADVYNVLPLGITPDSSQTLPVGYPMISAYLELADLKKLCALQLAAQTGLANPDYYLNFSGFRYSLNSTGSYLYFKYATAAAALQVVSQAAAAGLPAARQALAGVASLNTDLGGGLLVAWAEDNPFAGALVELNDVNPTAVQLNLEVVGQVAAAGAADAAAGTNTVAALIVSKAVDAIDTVSVFSPADGTNTGSTTDLTGSSRVRAATDLFGLLAMSAVQAQFGIAVTVYDSATGSNTLSSADLTGILANRISTAAPGAPVNELKEWMALLSYLGKGLAGVIGPAYASSSDFTQFVNSGAAVQTRNASYPVAAIGQLTGTLSNLLGTPACPAGKPSVAGVTNGTYGPSLSSSSGAIIVWGSGFSEGGNTVYLTGSGQAAPIAFNITAGSYFWDLSPDQINASIAGRATPGQWILSVRNACGATSAGFPITLQ